MGAYRRVLFLQKIETRVSEMVKKKRDTITAVLML